MFSLDVIKTVLTVWQIIDGLFVHNIFNLILLIILIISWKYEIVGAISFNIIGLLYLLSLIINFNFKWYMFSSVVLISGPAFFIGILFFINWFFKKNKK